MKISDNVKNVIECTWIQYDDITTNPIWRTATILKIFFCYISTNDCPINAKIGKEKQNLVLTQVM